MEQEHFRRPCCRSLCDARCESSTAESAARRIISFDDLLRHCARQLQHIPQASPAISLRDLAAALIRPHGMDQCGTGQWQTTELEHMESKMPHPQSAFSRCSPALEEARMSSSLAKNARVQDRCRENLCWCHNPSALGDTFPEYDSKSAEARKA